MLIQLENLAESREMDPCSVMEDSDDHRQMQC